MKAVMKSLCTGLPVSAVRKNQSMPAHLQGLEDGGVAAADLGLLLSDGLLVRGYHFPQRPDGPLHLIHRRRRQVEQPVAVLQGKHRRGLTIDGGGLSFCAQCIKCSSLRWACLLSQ